MYSDWSSHVMSSNEWLQQSESVLKGLHIPPDSAHQIVALVVQPLASSLTAIPTSSPKQMNDHHIVWCMEVIGYGLGLPLSEHETIRDCVHIYCEWLTVLLPQPKASVPLPLLKLPNHYSRKIFGQLYHLFLPRPTDDGPDLINRQAVLCHRVLRTIQLIATHSVIIDSDTWESLLILLLAINDALLPTSLSISDVGDHLCDRVLSALFDVWLHACARSFPSPRLWKSLTSLAKEWRQKPTLITHWNKINNSLASRLLSELCGPHYAAYSVNSDDKDIPSSLTGELLAQTWFRFLHCIGNPVPSISQSNNKVFRSGVLESSHSMLPTVSANVLVEFMRGISSLTDIILGRYSSALQRTSKTSIERNELPRDQVLSKARCNSLLHLFGSWLFQAALLDSDFTTRGASPFTTDRSRASSVSISSEPSLVMSRPRSATTVESFEPSSSIASGVSYDNGRAQAIGTLCRIVCSKKSDEEILPLYLARFFVALHCSLKLREEKCVSEVMASVFLNSPSLFRINLDGIFSVLPAVVDALECVLLPKDLKIKSNANRIEIRRAAIFQLISTVCVPQHYWQLSLKDFVGSNSDGMHVYFIHLRPRLLNLIFSALQNETDPLNLHLLLGCLGCVMKDVSAFEAYDPIPTNYGHNALSHSASNADGSSNVFSSVSDAHSWHSSTSVSYPSLNENIPGYPNDGDPLLCGYLSSIASAAVQMLSHKLLTLWKSDVNVSIAALEVLACMSKISSISANESHRVVYLLCEYIMVQCSRPPPAHSKDLHSTIVAALSCCGSWLSSHPYLATDTECLLACLQVIELGISGAISQTKGGDPRKKKHEKELKPVSLRVRDAAESLLTNLLEILGNSSQNVKSEKYSKHRRERGDSSSISEGSQTEDSSRSLYFASTDGTMLLSVKNESVKRDSSAEPVVTLRLRNPFGHQTWLSQMRHLPRHKSGMQAQPSNPGHPLAMNDLLKDQSLAFECFPESVERVRTCLADKSLPSLDSMSVSYEGGGSELELIASLINMSSESIFTENDVRSEKCEWEAPSESDSLRSARLFLSHLGLLRLGIQESDSNDTMFVGLDPSTNNFFRDLDDLDLTGPRSHDTVFIYYVKSGQKFSNEILSNTMVNIRDPRFSEFVRALGWPIDSSSVGDCSLRSDAQKELPKLQSQSFFWSDGLSDVTFVLRHMDPQQSEMTGVHFDSSIPRRSQEHVSFENSTNTRRSRLSNQLPNPEMKVIVVWLECFEDLNYFPADEMLEASYLNDSEQVRKEETIREHYFIFVHPLVSGLFRIHLQHSSSSKIQFATPLVDGAVVSQRTLGVLIRQTCINLGKRRRLDYESYQLPHVRRKVRIADIVNRYRTNLQPSSFITHMFSQL